MLCAIQHHVCDFEKLVSIINGTLEALATRVVQFQGLIGLLLTNDAIGFQITDEPARTTIGGGTQKRA